MLKKLNLSFKLILLILIVLLLVVFIFLFPIVTNISKKYKQNISSRKVSLFGFVPSDQSNLASNIKQIYIIPQNKLETSFGSLEQVVLQNLILEKYDLNENRVTLYFKYLLSKNLHTLIVEARSHFGTISGNYDINPKTFGIEYKIDDNVELIISYVPLKNDNNISSVKINIAQEQRSDITPDMKDKLVTFFGKFGDKPISLDQIRTKLYNNIVKFNDDTILVNAIIKNPRNKLNK